MISGRVCVAFRSESQSFFLNPLSIGKYWTCFFLLLMLLGIKPAAQLKGDTLCSMSLSSSATSVSQTAGPATLRPTRSTSNDCSVDRLRRFDAALVSDGEKSTQDDI
jgi:hypothetical protein